MAFHVKDFAAIAASSIEHARSTQRQITDFTVGSVARTLIEAPAIELDEFYQRVLFGLLEAIPVAVFNAFGFEALPAVAAAGEVAFTLEILRTTDLEIPAGTVVQSSDDGRRFKVVTPAVIAAHTWAATARVAAEQPGVAGNAGVGDINALVTPLPAAVTVHNALPIRGGKDKESAEDRKARFISYVGSLSRSTMFACEYAIRSTMLVDESGLPIEYVTHVGAVEVPGQVDFYIYSSAGVPSAALLDKIELTLNGARFGADATPGHRPVGVEIRAHAMQERLISLPMRLWLDGGIRDAIEVRVRDAVAQSIFSTAPGDTLYIDQIIDAVLSVRGVSRVIIGGPENIRCGHNEVLLLDDIAFTWET